MRLTILLSGFFVFGLALFLFFPSAGHSTTKCKAIWNGNRRFWCCSAWSDVTAVPLGASGTAPFARARARTAATR